MIPALTGYGYGVLRQLPSASAVTTGHAATVVSVVKTVLAAVAASRSDLSDMTVACVGLGSIGRSSLELLLARAAHSPARLILCEANGQAALLADVATSVREGGFVGLIDTCESSPDLPNRIYGADLIIGATSSTSQIIDIDSLRPGTIVVDDSFPHCFDPALAVERMQTQRDVLVVGGGLLYCGTAERFAAGSLPSAAIAERLSQLRLPGTIAACQLESLLQAATADFPPAERASAELPLVHGVVDTALALTYWAAAETFGIAAAPLHLLDHVVEAGLLLDPVEP